MGNYNTRYKLKAQNIKRWHTQPVLREQNLAEHQWNVTIIAVGLAEYMQLDGIALSTITKLALYHDMEEIETGDIPSPAKIGYRHSTTGDLYSDIVKVADKLEALDFYMTWGIDSDTTRYCRDTVDKFTKDTFTQLKVAVAKMRDELKI